MYCALYDEPPADVSQSNNFFEFSLPWIWRDIFTVKYGVRNVNNELYSTDRSLTIQQQCATNWSDREDMNISTPG